MGSWERVETMVTNLHMCQYEDRWPEWIPRIYTEETTEPKNQLQSAQTGLFPKLSGKLIITRIWSDQVMVDHFSDLTYVHLIRSTDQEETL